MSLTFDSSRFGRLEVDADAVIEFPAGLIGLGGERYALIATDPDAPFAWLHSVEDPDVALPVTNPWLHFGDFAGRPLRRRHRARGRRGPVAGRRLGHRSGRVRALGLQLQPPRADCGLEGPWPPGDQRGAGRPRPRSAVPRGRRRSGRLGGHTVPYREFQGGIATVLIITRKPGEKIMLGDDVVVHVMEIVGNSVRVGIQAPRSLPVYREEIWDAVRQENRAAADVAPDALPAAARPRLSRRRPRRDQPAATGRAPPSPRDPGGSQTRWPDRTCRRSPPIGDFFDRSPRPVCFRRTSPGTVQGRVSDPPARSDADGRQGKLLAICGAVAAAGAAALLKRDKVAALLPSRTGGEPPPRARAAAAVELRRPGRSRTPRPRCPRPTRTRRRRGDRRGGRGGRRRGRGGAIGGRRATTRARTASPPTRPSARSPRPARASPRARSRPRPSSPTTPSSATTPRATPSARSRTRSRPPTSRRPARRSTDRRGPGHVPPARAARRTPTDETPRTWWAAASPAARRAGCPRTTPTPARATGRPGVAGGARRGRRGRLAHLVGPLGQAVGWPFYERDGDVYVPSELTRGPWDPGRPARRPAVRAPRPGDRGARPPRRADHDRDPARRSRSRRLRWRTASCARAATSSSSRPAVRGPRRAARAGRAPRPGGCCRRTASPRDPGPPPPGPDAGTAQPFFQTGALAGYHTAMDVRFVTGGFTEIGPGASPGSGCATRSSPASRPPRSPAARRRRRGQRRSSGALDFRRYVFINTELTVHLVREPAGEWVCLDAVTPSRRPRRRAGRERAARRARAARPRRAVAVRPPPLTAAGARPARVARR